MNEIQADLQAALAELISVTPTRPGQILVVGCSTSEILGTHIGKGGSIDVAEMVYSVLESITAEHGLFLAVQCCEHLNRALVVKEECLLEYGLTEVSVVPHEKAGGALGTVAYRRMPGVMVESVAAHLGIDIGDTLIGMQLRQVAVPVRLAQQRIGQANLVAARTRPKLIGGARARYE
ncbi:MAG TPA: TIGR01440 family protein [Bacillota bacterium]|nr:TIGR01440 family protein [Bacillota bacterium]